MTARWKSVACTAAVVVVGFGVAACSSDPPGEPTRPGTVPAGTATTSIDGGETSTETKVLCETHGELTIVNTGTDDKGFTAVVSSDPALALKSISIRDVGGFTGSYFNGLGKPAAVTMTGRTYEISGLADGFATDRPSFRTSGEFAIKASC